jgi:uncharacterized protein YndB with AHSA1/START domain
VTNDSKFTDRGIDLTIDIDATLEEVWQALTTGEGIARWFGPYAAVTPGEGGSVSVGWSPHEMWETPITVWEPQRRMQTASEMPSKAGGMVRLAVDYYLEVQGGRVRVRLVHSGFDDSSWDDYIDGLDAGWSFFLFNLKHALERHRGVDRVQQSARFRTTARAGEEHPVFGACGLRLADCSRATPAASHSAAPMSTPPWPCGTHRAPSPSSYRRGTTRSSSSNAKG